MKYYNNRYPKFKIRVTLVHLLNARKHSGYVKIRYIFSESIFDTKRVIGIGNYRSMYERYFINLNGNSELVLI